MSVFNKSGISKGFTLVELMIVVALVGILAAVAYPSYIEQVYKAKRATAATSVLECVAVLERRFSLTSTYTTDACDAFDNDDYVITINLNSGNQRNGRDCTANGRENCFLVTATSQISGDTACASMGINELGVKEASPTANVEKCWRTT